MNIIITITATEQYFVLVKKEELETGDVNRLCATKEKCESAISSTRSTCCSGERCNNSPSYSSLSAMALGVVVLMLRATFLVF